MSNHFNSIGSKLLCFGAPGRTNLLSHPLDFVRSSKFHGHRSQESTMDSVSELQCCGPSSTSSSAKRSAAQASTAHKQPASDIHSSSPDQLAFTTAGGCATADPAKSPLTCTWRCHGRVSSQQLPALSRIDARAKLFVIHIVRFVTCPVPGSDPCLPVKATVQRHIGPSILEMSCSSAISLTHGSFHEDAP